jgi:hypothetical protein
MTRLAQLIAHNEGFGVPGAVPTTHNNPGDLRHSPHSQHPVGEPNSIGAIDTVADGWADLERQLELYAQRGFTLRELAYTYAPPADGNPTEAYLASITSGLNLPDTALVSTALTIPAIGGTM